jgi:hypothetical protein
MPFIAGVRHEVPPLYPSVTRGCFHIPTILRPVATTTIARQQGVNDGRKLDHFRRLKTGPPLLSSLR